MSLEILKKYKIRAKKWLGQNFLVNEKIVEDIAWIVDLTWENILEVWPWYGALTEKIIGKKPKSLTLVELDLDMIEILNDRIKNDDLNILDINFEIKNIDILKYVPDYKNYYVIANIPYYITSPILRHFLYNIENKPKKMLILMQKDVWEKIILWQNDNKKKNKSSVLSLFIAKKCYVKEALFVAKENFIPAPKIESSVMLFESHNLYEKIDDEKFLKIIKIAFSESRKKMIKNLVKWGFEKEEILKIYSELSLDENVRADWINIETWCLLVEKL